MMKIFFKKLDENAVIPTRGSESAAGMDLTSVIDTVVYPDTRAIIATGLSCKPPKNTYLRIAPRSGLAAKNGIDVLAGVVDSDYRGELKVILQNMGDEPLNIKIGDRIAQAILECYVSADIEEVDTLDETDRGVSGFGSTGI